MGLFIYRVYFGELLGHLVPSRSSANSFARPAAARVAMSTAPAGGSDASHGFESKPNAPAPLEMDRAATSAANITLTPETTQQDDWCDLEAKLARVPPGEPRKEMDNWWTGHYAQVSMEEPETSYCLWVQVKRDEYGGTCANVGCFAPHCKCYIPVCMPMQGACAQRRCLLWYAPLCGCPPGAGCLQSAFGLLCLPCWMIICCKKPEGGSCCSSECSGDDYEVDCWPLAHYEYEMEL